MMTFGRLPAGHYYVGDPCYVIRNDAAWSSFLDALYAAEKASPNGENEAVMFEWNGLTCFVSPTNTGDGCYRDQYGEVYGVDAGMIAAIPVGMFGGRLGTEFPKDFKVSATPGRWNRHGKTIRIGHISIRT